MLVLRTPVTSILIGVNVLVALLAILSAGTVPWSSITEAAVGGSTPLHLVGALVPRPTRFTDIAVTVAGVSGGEYWRLLTSMFLHFGLLHLLLNMYALFSIGPALELAFGRARYLALYLVAGLAGSVAVYLFAGDTLTAGASGAIFGLFGAMVPLLRRMRQSLVAIVPVVLINLGITFAIPGISIAGHLGGLAAGLILGTVLSHGAHSRRAILLGFAGAGGALLVAAVIRTLQLSG